MSSQQARVVTSECQTNKLLTPTTTSDAQELFLNTHDVADSLSVTEHEHTATLKLQIKPSPVCKIRTSCSRCESKILVNWLCKHMCTHASQRYTEIKASERVTIAHAGDLWCHCS